MTTPVTPTEALVAEVLCKMLEVDSVDVSQDFFELGGHSLLAVQVVHELSERTRLDLDLESFFDLATVDRIAAEIDRRRELADAAPAYADEGEL
ncbi:phosphopantetheine-binding protein [Hamadaea tsunoensis]|uniref:phosphopantetheine-binding protein n=1 Tax=Hamadaea tsunoensis TaxID=53368 RepID=UPI0004049C15|nr:phosphopantetheine-binding protein [Hamadaea tsunoensis]